MERYWLLYCSLKALYSLAQRIELEHKDQFPIELVRKELLKTALVSLRMSDRQLLEEVNILAMAITGVSIIDSEMMNKYYPEDEKQHD